MTKRTLGLASLHALSVASILMLNEQAAYSSDTIWDLLRKGDPAHKRETSIIPLGKIAGVDTSNQPKEVFIDPKTGRQMVVPEGSLSKKPKGGVLGFFDTMGTTFQRLGRQMNSNIKITGEKKIGFHAESIGGNSETYQNDVYYGRRGTGGTYNDTDLLVQGKIGGILNFETHYTDRLYGNPQDNRVSLNYATKSFKFDAGDIQAGIVGNSLLDFNRSLKGIQLSADVFKGMRLTSLFSQTKAQTRTVVLQGANSSGPYYVYAGQVVDGSEKVRVNNRDMVKGVDYTLDPTSGRLDFLKGLIIGTGETIAVTFETYGYQSQAGTLMGWRADMNFLKSAKFGLTFLSQTSANANASSPERTEPFPGYQNETTAYVLQYPVAISVSKDSKGNAIATPLKPMKLTIDGVPKIYGTDYVVNPYLPNQVFIRGSYVPDTKIFITYTPENDNQAGGNRKVMGADANFSLGKVGTITAEMASSTLDLSSKSLSGSAIQLRGDMRFFKDKLAWNWNFRNIGDNFAAIESPGFNRNEKGMTMGFNYSPTKNLKFNANIEKSKRPSYDYSSLTGGTGLAQSNGSDDYTQTLFGGSWQIGKIGQLNFNHNSMSTLSFGGGKSIFGSDTLNFTYNGIKAFSFDMSLGRNTNQSLYNSGSTSGSGTNSLTSYNNNTLTSRLNMTWTASQFIRFNAVLSNNAISSGNGTKTNAQDIQFTSDITPLRNMRLTLGYQLQNSGSTAVTTGTTTTTPQALGVITPLGAITRQSSPFDTSSYGSSYGNSFGGGYNGNLGSYGNYSGGIVGGFNNNYSGVSYGGNSRALTAGLTYQPVQSLNFAINWNSSSSQGDFLQNSRRNDIAFTASYSMGERLSLTTSFNTQKVAYIGSTGGTSSNSMNFSITSKPFGRLMTNLNYMVMKSNSDQASSTTGTTGTPIPDPSSPTGGYNPFFGAFNSNMNSFGIELQYPLYRTNNLFMRLDNSTTGGYGASDSRTLSFGMIFDLGNRTNFTLGWRNQQHISRDATTSTNYNYKVSSLDAELGIHF